jgi:hypothetical protein
MAMLIDTLISSLPGNPHVLEASVFVLFGVCAPPASSLWFSRRSGA